MQLVVNPDSSQVVCMLLFTTLVRDVKNYIKKTLVGVENVHKTQ